MAGQAPDLASSHPTEPKEEYRVLITSGPAEGSNCEAQSFLMPHPRTRQEANFMVVGGVLHEVNWYRPEFGSWFAGDTVIEDGGLYLATPCDPVFPLLPLLEVSRRQGGCEEGVFCSAAQMLEGAHPALTGLLAGPDGGLAAALEVVCDVKEAGGERYLRLNDGKVLAWLLCKVEAVQAGLLASPAREAYCGMEPRSLAAYAVGLLGENLPELWLERLARRCGIPPPGAVADAAPMQTDSPVDNRANKKPKLDPNAIARKKAQEARNEAKAAKLKKEAAGMKSIGSFFGKKA